MFDAVDSCCLIVGCGRSGSTILGAILDAHPEVICANESRASANFWRGYDRDSLFTELHENALAQRASGRQSEGYTYAIAAGNEDAPIRVVADKTWNPALVMLHGRATLIAELGEMTGVPIRFLHAIRNPWDVIATMHLRSGATLADRAHWYFIFCDAATALMQRGDLEWMDVHHEALIDAPRDHVAAITAFLGLEADAQFIEACAATINTEPSRSRERVDWPADVAALIESRMPQYPFLERYLSR